MLCAVKLSDLLYIPNWLRNMTKRTFSTDRDLTIFIGCLVDAVKAAGLDMLSLAQKNELLAALDAKIGTDREPRIHPDGRYPLKEVERLGYGGKGQWYGKRKHLIRKDRDCRGSFVLGADLLALNEAALTVAESPALLSPNKPGFSCGRGRPREA